MLSVQRPVLSIAALGALAIIATACASTRTSAPTPQPQRTTLRVGGSGPTVIHTEAAVGQGTLPYSPEAVWGTMTAVFEQLDIPVDHAVSAQMEIGNLNHHPRRIEGKRMANYIDCGTNFNGALANTHDITLSIMVRVTPTDDGGSTITTVMDAFGDPSAVSGNTIHCESQGTLEERIPEIVAERLGGIS